MTITYYIDRYSALYRTWVAHTKSDNYVPMDKLYWYEDHWGWVYEGLQCPLYLKEYTPTPSVLARIIEAELYGMESMPDNFVV
jgi:hypothetical protein